MTYPFEKLFPENLYHSYVIEGDPVSTGLVLIEFLEKRGVVEKQSPNLLFQIYESFTIDDSSDIKDWHSKRGIGEGKKICIIATKFINREAEQTLLKIIEEPMAGTHFFIIIPDSSVLLDTIISRTHVVKTAVSVDIDLQKFVVKFIASSPKDRIDKVATIIKENKDEENSGKLRSYATKFVNELENIFYQKFKKNINNEQIKFVLNELQKARDYLSTSGASVKMILEHLALVI